MRVWAYVEGERRESGGEEATEAEEAEVPDAVLSGDQDAGQRSGGRWSSCDHREEESCKMDERTERQIEHGE